MSSDDALSEHAIWIPPPKPEAVIVSYSQNAEDVRLARVLDSSTGFYVDVGAGDPAEFSLTKHFYDRGWSGINVEPGPAFERLEQARPRDVNLRLAVAPEREEREFWLSNPHWGLSTLSPPHPSDPIPEGFRFERRSVTTRPLSDIVREHAAGKRIDFLTIDVEGAEESVIRSMDFELSRPTIVIVEAIRPFTYEPSHSDWEPILLAAGYELATFDGINRFYVAREHRHLIPALAYPITALDAYVRPLAPAAAEGGNAGDLQRTPTGPGSFPTLAERLDRRPPTGEIAAPPKPLVLLIESDEPPALVSQTVARIRATATRASILGIVEGDAALTTTLADEDTDDTAPWQTHPFRRLRDLRALLDDAPERDVVVIEPGHELTAETLAQLASAAYADSVCTSVSDVPPVVAGAPPASAASPFHLRSSTTRRGVSSTCVETCSTRRWTTFLRSEMTRQTRAFDFESFSNQCWTEPASCIGEARLRRARACQRAIEARHPVPSARSSASRSTRARSTPTYRAPRCSSSTCSAGSPEPERRESLHSHPARFTQPRCPWWNGSKTKSTLRTGGRSSKPMSTTAPNRFTESPSCPSASRSDADSC